jgi:hypothetical protein
MEEQLTETVAVIRRARPAVMALKYMMMVDGGTVRID